MKIISRKEWGALFGVGDLDAGPEPRVVIHHSYRPALDTLASQTQEESAVRAIERFHVHDKGWPGIGYNFLVAPSGRVYEGRGWKYRGIHAGPVNGSSIGICLLINGSSTEANEQTILSVRQLIAEGVRVDELAANYIISGHRDHMQRTCPGDKVYAQLSFFRHDAERAPVIPDRLERIDTGPPVQPPILLEPIYRPTAADIERVLRLRGVQPATAAPVMGAVEDVARALLRGMEDGAEVAGREAVGWLADALADWIREKAA